MKTRTNALARPFTFLRDVMVARRVVVGMACIIAATGCGEGGEVLSAADVYASPERVVPVGLFYNETHVALVQLQLTGTDEAVAVDAAEVETSSGPADLGVRLTDSSPPQAEVRVTARGSAGIFTATILLTAGGQKVPVSVVVPVRPPPSCDDGNPCTTDWREGAACLHEPIAAGSPCDDGNACTTGDMCNAEVCGGAALSCDDDVECTENTCDPAVGCTFVPNASRCDDGDACTDDICDADLGCRQEALPEGSICAGEGGCENVGFCIQSDCVESAVPDGFWCDDGDACTTGDTCTGGVCLPGPDSAGPRTPEFVEIGPRNVDVCGGLNVQGACNNVPYLAPEAVLDVLDDGGQSHVLWRTFFVNEYGNPCDPNFDNALFPVDVDGDSDGLIDQGDEVEPQEVADYCAAAVFITTYSWDTRAVERFAVGSVEGAVAAKFLGAENVLFQTPAEEGARGIANEDTDADGLPADETTAPIQQSVYAFVMVSAPREGGGLALVNGVSYGGAPTLDQNFLSPNIATPITRAGALDLAVVGQSVTAIMLESQSCPYANPAQNALCFPLMSVMEWEVGSESLATYQERVVQDFGCHAPAQVIESPRVSIAQSDGTTTFALGLFNPCAGTHQVSAGVFTAFAAPPVFAQRSFSLTEVHSMQVFAGQLYLSGTGVFSGFFEVGEEDIPNIGPTYNAVVSNLTTTADHYLQLQPNAALLPATAHGDGDYFVLSGQSLTLSNLYDDGPGLSVELPGTAGAMIQRPLRSSGGISGFSAAQGFFPDSNAPVPPPPENGIIVARWGCF